MRCNWWRWLWGIIPLLVLGWVAVQAEHGRLEADLTDRGKALLAAKGFNWATIEFEGRDAVLAGLAPQEGDPGKAAGTLASLYGVRVVNNRAGLLDKADKFVWTASRRSNRIRLTGFAPNINARQAILGVTRASFPGLEVVDRTTLARGAPPTDVWLAGVSFILKQLTSIKAGGHGRLEDLGISLYGEAEDVAGYLAIKQALAGGLPKGLKVLEDGVTAPVVSPYAWEAKRIGGRLVLTGYVANDKLRAEIVEAAKGSSAGVEVVDEMQPGEGAPQGWAAAVSAALHGLARLEDGSAQMQDAALTVSGLAPDAATADAVRAELRAALAAKIKFIDHIRAKEPPPPPPPKEAEAPAPGVVAKAKACEEEMAEQVAKGTILFALSSAELDSVSFPTLDKLAETAKACPGMTIEVAGHASAEGDPEANRQLSLRRAQSVAAYLARAGVEQGQLHAVGYGATRPVAPNDTAENMARNRRIEFTVRPR
jgi:OOP family OmpA-OmpF porin